MGYWGGHTTKQRAFTQDDIHFLQAVANVLATTIERKHVQERLEYLAYYDTLTKLPNRQLFVDRLRQALAQAKRYGRLTAILFLGLDRFKRIIESLGNDIGNVVLKTISSRLQDCVRKIDSVARPEQKGSATTIARLGGDEFIMLLVEIATTQDSTKVAQRILDILRQPHTLEGHELLITGSIGISLYPSDGDKEETLIQNASAAMFRAREQGGDNFQFYSSEMHTRASERLEMEMNLRKALERRELLVHYQPQVDLQTGQIVGTEGLLRWQHSDRGLISPAQFIPLAEETGLIVPMGEWILRTACAQNKAWHAAGLGFIRVAVNLSARQFHHQNLVETIVRILKETGLDPKYLELELTESILMQNVEATIKMLCELHAMGIGLSIDDFGTGYSSLSYLKRFPIDILKIDQSFVRDITTDPDDAAIVTAIITLAHSLKLKAIAEGVETEEQLEFLRSLHCDGMQGYLFSRPLPVDEATKLLAEHRCLLGKKPRKDPRFVVNLKVEYAMKDKIVAKYVTNMSKGGIFIQTEDPLPIAEEVPVKLTLPESNTIIEVVGKVVWTYDVQKGDDQVRHGMGIRFVNLSPEWMALLEDYIEKLSSPPQKVQ